MNKNKVFLVSGAASGIGLAIAEQAIAAGATVVGSDINAEALEQCRQRLGDQFIATVSDASDPEAIKQLVNFIEEDLGRLDVLVNNAGTAVLNTPESITEDIYDQQMAIFLKGPSFAVKYAAQLLRAADDGVVINISSASAVISMPGYFPYGIAKEAIAKFTEDCVINVPGIRHNVILPGLIDTPILKIGYGEEAAAQLKVFAEAYCPVPRMGQPTDVASVVLFLASEQAGYINGSRIVIDGGLTKLHALSMSKGDA